MSTPQPPYRTTATTHIRALSTLNERLPHLLTTSATTISQLTNAPIRSPTSSPSAPDTPAARSAALAATANTFYTTVLELRAALHAQIDDLEKLGVVLADEEVRYRAPVGVPPGGAARAGEGEEAQGSGEGAVTNGGLGGFDVGVLNARAGVRQREGGEVVDRVRRVLEGLVGDGVKSEEKGGEDEKMADG